MAALALAAVLTQMDVVLLVAGQAVLIELDLIGRLLVAAGTLQFSMCPRQGKSCLLAVVKFPDLPPVRRMTLGTLGPQ